MENILESIIQKERLVWQKFGFFWIVNLSKQFSFPRPEENNSSVQIPDGEHSICREIPEKVVRKLKCDGKRSVFSGC